MIKSKNQGARKWGRLESSNIRNNCALTLNFYKGLVEQQPESLNNGMAG